MPTRPSRGGACVPFGASGTAATTLPSAITLQDYTQGRFNAYVTGTPTFPCRLESSLDGTSNWTFRQTIAAGGTIAAWPQQQLYYRLSASLGTNGPTTEPRSQIIYASAYPVVAQSLTLTDNQDGSGTLSFTGAPTFALRLESAENENGPWTYEQELGTSPLSFDWPFLGSWFRVANSGGQGEPSIAPYSNAVYAAPGD